MSQEWSEGGTARRDSRGGSVKIVECSSTKAESKAIYVGYFRVLVAVLLWVKLYHKR